MEMNYPLDGPGRYLPVRLDGTIQHCQYGNVVYKKQGCNSVQRDFTQSDTQNIAADIGANRNTNDGNPSESGQPIGAFEQPDVFGYRFHLKVCWT